VCGECGTPYKRCTWARNGKKRIVWRCISRLEFGKKYCHNSPTIDEEKLHTAILEAMNDMAQAQSEVSDAALELAATACAGSQDGKASLMELKDQMAELTAQQGELLERVLEDMDNLELNARLKELTEKKEALQAEIEVAQEDERQRAGQESRLEELRKFMGETPTQFTEYEDEIVRKMIEKITVVDSETIRIRFKGSDAEVDKKLTTW